VRPTAVYHLSGSRVGSFRPVWCRIESQTERCVGIATKQRHCETDEGKGTVKYSSGKLSPSLFSLLSLLFPLLSPLPSPLLSSFLSLVFKVPCNPCNPDCPLTQEKKTISATASFNNYSHPDRGNHFISFFTGNESVTTQTTIPSNHAGLRSSGRFCPLGPFVLAKLAF